MYHGMSRDGRRFAQRVTAWKNVQKVVQFKSAYPHTPHRERQDVPELGAAV